MTIGTFDCFHHGHERLLARAARFGTLFVGVNSDRFIATYKGRRPDEGWLERVARIRANPLVAAAWINDGPGVDLIRLVQPDFLVVGSDWHERDYLAQIGMTPAELFGDLHCGIVYLPRTPGVSTTELRA